MKIITWENLSADEKLKILCRPITKLTSIAEKVAEIINSVKIRGDAALFELTEKYDNAQLNTLQVSSNEINEAEIKVNKSSKNAIITAYERITNYQTQCKPKAITINNDGIICQKIPTPIDAVGLYVPGGTAPLISTLMMLAVPAKIAECPTRILCTPPNAQGEINPALLFTAKLCGIETIYKIGGAQAIAAMAYGSESVTKVNKIFGPGNSWVTEAKQQVAVDALGASIDMPAGPSEVLIIADESANADYIAADLLSQAEHGSDSQVILITDSMSLAKKVQSEIEIQLAKLLRKSIAEKALQISLIFVVNKIAEAFDISNNYAPEHLILKLQDADTWLNKVRNAGAVFVGEFTAETMGDYINGANHVLPTYGFAKTTSGLSVSDFMKFISVQTVSQTGLEKYGPTAMQLAELEGLDAHKNAVAIRLNDLMRPL